MGDFMFGLGPGHLPQHADAIAARHGASLVNYTEPNGDKRHWFACVNRGEPCDGDTARAVLADLVAEGLISGA